MTDKLTDEQVKRYSCSTFLKEIGEQGQLKLLNAKVLVVGAGGLASSVLMYLVSSGIGFLGVIDDDKVSLDNLPRQILFNASEVGKKKVIVAKERLEQLNSDTKVTIYDKRLTNDNAEELFKDYDLILDCVDNFETKFLINDICVKLHKPFVTAGVSDYKGQVMSYIPSQSKHDFKSLFSELPINIEQKYKDEDRGVFPPSVGIISNIEVCEALKIIIGAGKPLIDEMLVVDTLDWYFHKMVIK